jgi:hypothetical protein
MGRECSTHGDKRNAYRVFVGKPEVKRPLRITRREWEDFMINLRKMRWNDVDWSHMAQNRDH